MPFFQNAQNTDTRYGIFNEVAGNQTNYRGGGWSGEDTLTGRGDEQSKHHVVVDFTESPKSEFNGWNVGVHPDGWRYFYSAGFITDDDRLANKSPSSVTSQIQRLDDHEEVLCSSESKSGLVVVKTYVNHKVWYASSQRDAVNRTNLTPEEGKIFCIIIFLL